MHEWPKSRDDAVVAERLPQLLRDFAAQAAAARAADDKARLEQVMRATQLALFA
jgi:hypothetical protein